MPGYNFTESKFVCSYCGAINTGNAKINMVIATCTFADQFFHLKCRNAVLFCSMYPRNPSKNRYTAFPQTGNDKHCNVDKHLHNIIHPKLQAEIAWVTGVPEGGGGGKGGRVPPPPMTVSRRKKRERRGRGKGKKGEREKKEKKGKKKKKGKGKKRKKKRKGRKREKKRKGKNGEIIFLNTMAVRTGGGGGDFPENV